MPLSNPATTPGMYGRGGRSVEIRIRQPRFPVCWAMGNPRRGYTEASAGASRTAILLPGRHRYPGFHRNAGVRLSAHLAGVDERDLRGADFDRAEFHPLIAAGDRVSGAQRGELAGLSFLLVLQEGVDRVGFDGEGEDVVGERDRLAVEQPGGQ